MNVTIHPGTPKGVFVAPPSKSVAHRLLICAALAPGTSEISNVAPCEDILATIDCLRILGAVIRADWVSGKVTVTGAHPAQRTAEALPCRESGSTLRFLLPLCLFAPCPSLLCGSDRLLQRPLTVYEQLGQTHGFSVRHTPEGIRVEGSLRGGVYTMRGDVSSQFITGLLAALPLCETDSEIRLLPPVESRSYIALTLHALSAFGVKAFFRDENTITVPGNQVYRPGVHTVEGDYSGAAFFFGMNTMGAHIQIQGLQADSCQGDRIVVDYLKKLEQDTPTLSLQDCPDLAPILFAVAGVRNGAVFTQTRRLAIKESDRGEAMRQELAKCGITVVSEENRITVYPAQPHPPSEPICSHNDHRIVMAMAALLTLTGGEISGCEAVAKSMPDFFEKLKMLGIAMENDDTDE